MKVLWTYIKHFIVVCLILISVAIPVGISQHASVNFGDNPLAWKVGDEGPFVFVGEDGGLLSQTIRGGREQGFVIESDSHPAGQPFLVTVKYHADDSGFSFVANPDFATPASHYQDDQQVLVISDIEGKFGTFRDFLLANEVVDDKLNWQFGQGHLVLLGDFVDRGDATFQVLWFIYKLEQEARLAGGQVHYIIGNHEIKNLQGNFKSASDKYQPIAGLLGKTQPDLLGPDSLLGRWMASKNAVEQINGVLFAHGGLHPSLAGLQLDDINQRIRRHYRQMYYPGVADPETERLISTDTGPAWYRGYFKDDVTEEQLDDLLAHFDAKAIAVGHTLQFSVNAQFGGRVLAVDVKHPSYYRSSFPVKRSQGLLMEQGRFFRLQDDGERTLLPL